MDQKEAAKLAASILGSIKTPRKSASSRKNIEKARAARKVNDERCAPITEPAEPELSLKG